MQEWARCVREAVCEFLPLYNVREPDCILGHLPVSSTLFGSLFVSRIFSFSFLSVNLHFLFCAGLYKDLQLMPYQALLYRMVYFRFAHRRNAVACV